MRKPLMPASIRRITSPCPPIPLSLMTMRLRSTLEASLGCRQIRGERGQVAIVDADQSRLHCHRALQLRLVMDFDQHAHAHGLGSGLEFDRLAMVEHGQDQENGVGPHGACFMDLVGIDHEVLAQDRQARYCLGQLQVGRFALEEGLVGQDRQARRATIPVGLGNCGNLEVAANETLGWAGLLISAISATVPLPARSATAPRNRGAAAVA